MKFIGFIEELKRVDLTSEEIDKSQDVDSGTVVIRADIDGRFKKVLLDLDGRQYDMAIEAHRSRSMMQAVGTLRKDGRSWRLDQPLLSAVVAKK